MKAILENSLTLRNNMKSYCKYVERPAAEYRLRQQNNSETVAYILLVYVTVLLE